MKEREESGRSEGGVMSKAEREKEQRGISCRYLQIPDVHPRANPVCKSVSKFKSLQPPAIYSTSVCKAKVGVIFLQPQAIYSTSVCRARVGVIFLQSPSYIFNQCM